MEFKGNYQTLDKLTTFMMNQMNAHYKSIRSTDFLVCLSLLTLQMSRPNFPVNLSKLKFFKDVSSCWIENI